MRRSREFQKQLKKDGERLPVPEGIAPKEIEALWKEKQERKQERRYIRRTRLYPVLAGAACLCLFFAGAFAVGGLGVFDGRSGAGQTQEGEKTGMELAEEEKRAQAENEERERTTGQEECSDQIELAKASYEEIYAKLSAVWEEDKEALEERALLEDGVSWEAESAESAMDLKQGASKEQEEAFGETNLRERGIDEGDLIKNDGRYLYQLAYRQEGKTGVRIVDTEGGLRETAFVGSFENPCEIYVQEDLLLVIDIRYEEHGYGTAEEAQEEGMIACSKDVLYWGNPYYEIYLYDISDREAPRAVRSFTISGSYQTSRIAEGYFYGFCYFTPKQGEGEEDYEAYIPKIDGNLLEADKILSGSESVSGRQYLVMVSIDLAEPLKLLDSRAVLADNGLFYVSGDSIYLAEYHSVYERVEESGQAAEDSTSILRFSYLNGRFYTQAEGSVPGRIDDSFSIDQKGNYLRVVTTAEESSSVRELIDDRTGEKIGYDYEVSNAGSGVYILNRKLEKAGELTGLAKGESVYSVRFLGDMAYFVTFLQTDPLFAVDVSVPESPKLLGELKISGFSEYLHDYGNGLLLGLGREADTKTGEAKGLKLSMFDLTDPREPAEQAKLHLENYPDSPALYDYKSLLIDTKENLIGFEARSYREGYRQDYFVFSYEDGAFVQRLKIQAQKNESEGRGDIRGTFIGDVFYLLDGDGGVEAYDLNTGKLLERLS